MNYSVTVLMSTYNGEKYIDEQIRSIFMQEKVDVKLLIRDDGSTDQTIEHIKFWRAKYPIEFINGKNLGYAKSFMTLVKLAKKTKSDFYAFCDQDDVWETEKLFRAIQKLNTELEKPALYLSQAKIVDSELNPINTLFHKRKINLGAVLEHNFAIGCTMVFNCSLRNILDVDVNSMELRCGHDSWTFLVALAVDAKIYYDINGYVLYRQHGNNTSGKILSFKQAISAINKILFKWKYTRSQTALKLIKNYENYINIENYELLRMAAKKKNLAEKLKFAFNRKMHSEYLAVDILFIFAVLFDLF